MKAHMPVFRLAVIASSAVLMCAAASAQNLVYPSPPQPEAQALVQRFQADFAKVSADPAYFTLPASAPAPGCDISKSDLYKAAGLAMALPEEAAKISKMTRKQLRDMGMDPEQAAKPTEYSNVNVVALSVPCKNGKVDGEVETIASFDTLMSMKNTMNMGQKMVTMTMDMGASQTKRARSLFVAGELKRMVFSADRTFSRNKTTYDDPATQEMMNKHAVPDAKEPSVMLMYTAPEEGGLMGMFTVATTPKFSAGLFGVTTTFERQLTSMFMSGITGKGRSVQKMQSYTGATFTMESEQGIRDGKPNGEQIIRTENHFRKNNIRMDQVPGFENARIVSVNGVEMIEQRNCYIDGALVKTATCPKD